MSRVCILCSQHVPDDVRVTHRLGKRFREKGHDVTWIGPKRNRTGDDYGIRFVYYPPGNGKLGRLTHAARLLRASHTIPPQDVYFAVEPDSAAVAVKLARAHSARAVFDIHEIYHEEMLLRWVPRAFIGIVGLFIKWRIRCLCRACDLVVGVGQSRLASYLEQNTKGMIVRHCVPLEFAPSIIQTVFPNNRDSMIILHGKTTMSHGTREIMEAVAMLSNIKNIPCRIVMFKERSDISIVGETPVGKLAKKFGITDCIDLRDPVPFRTMFSLMQTCDVGVIAYRRDFGTRCMPNRVFEYMAAGLPVIAPSYAEEMQRIIPKYGCGILCDTESPRSLCEAMMKLWTDKEEARRMGRNGRAAFESELNWETESQPLMDWIEQGPAICP